MSIKLPARAFLKLPLLLFLSSLITAESKVYAQSILLPGDILFTQVNSDGDELEIVPLIDIKAGTVIFLGNEADALIHEDAGSNTGLRLVFHDLVYAGTAVRIRNRESEFAEITGNMLPAAGRQHRFIYQKEDSLRRYISGVSWGGGAADNAKTEQPADDIGSADLQAAYHLKLGGLSGYRYSIRNGVSGTGDMLRNMLLTTGNWVDLSTLNWFESAIDFHIAHAPVIQFSSSMNVVGAEADSIEVMVSIFEHDGSKLTVNVQLDTTASTLSPGNFGGFTETKVNFTGLIGDGDFGFRLPLIGLDNLSGLKTAVFFLKDLSSGSFGNFVTNTLIVHENEKPSVRMQLVQNELQPGLIIYNMGNRAADFSGWQLKRGRRIITLPKGTSIGEGGKLILSPAERADSTQQGDIHYRLTAKEADFFKETGKITLYGSDLQKIGEIETLPNKNVSPFQSSVNRVGDALPEYRDARQTGGASSIVENQSSPGWLNLPYNADIIREYPEHKFYVWHESAARFEVADSENPPLQSFGQAMTVFDNESVAQLKAKNTSAGLFRDDEVLRFTVSATDSDLNGKLNGAEGLNRFVNTGRSPVSAGLLKQQIADRLGTETLPVIFSESEAGTRSLYDNEYIESGQIFWIKLRNLSDEETVELNPFAPANYSVMPEDSQMESGFSLVLIQGESEKHVAWHFEETDSVKLPRVTLDGLIHFGGSGEDGLLLSFINGEDRVILFSSLVSELQNTLLPLQITAPENEALKLSVEDWKKVPADISIILEDRLRNKEYELHPGWSINLTDDMENITSAEAPDEEPPVGNRFVLKAVSGSAYQNADGESVDVPKILTLYQNYPNPFNPLTTISFYLPEASEVRLSVFNIVGQPVAELIQATMAAGEHKIEWDATDIPSGMYIYQLEAGAKIMTRKMTLVK